MAAFLAGLISYCLQSCQIVGVREGTGFEGIVIYKIKLFNKSLAYHFRLNVFAKFFKNRQEITRPGGGSIFVKFLLTIFHI